jgi:hypothetical protein
VREELTGANEGDDTQQGKSNEGQERPAAPGADRPAQRRRLKVGALVWGTIAADVPPSCSTAFQDHWSRRVPGARLQACAMSSLRDPRSLTGGLADCRQGRRADHHRVALTDFDPEVYAEAVGAKVRAAAGVPTEGAPVAADALRLVSWSWHSEGCLGRDANRLLSRPSNSFGRFLTKRRP